MAFVDVDQRADVNYRALVESLIDIGLIAVSENHHILSWNEGAQRLTGLAPQDVIGKSILNFFSPLDGNTDTASYLDALLQQGGGSLEGWLHRIDQLVWRVRMSVGHFENTTGMYRVAWQPWGQTASVARPTAPPSPAAPDEALRASENRYRSLLEMAPDGIGIFQDQRLVYANRAAATLMGAATPSDLIGLDFQQYVHPDDWTQVQQRMSALLSHETILPLHTVRLRRLDGKFIDIETCGGTCVFDGRPAIQVIGRDITERKQTDQLLLRQQQLQTEAQSLAHLGSFEWRMDSNELIWSDELYRIYGIDPSEFGGSLLAFMDRIHPDDREMVFHTIQNALEHRTSFRMEERIVRGDGEIRVLESSGRVIVNQDNQPIRIIGACVDITERKQAEQALRHSEEQWRAFFDTSNAGMAELSPTGQFLLANDALCEMLGYTRHELMTMTLADILPEHERARAYADFGRLSRDEALEYRAERQYRRQDGTLLAAHVHASIAQRQQGKPTAIAGVLIDVTDLKRAEGLLRSVLDSVADAIVTMDKSGGILSANPSTETIFGYHPDEIIGQNIRTLLPHLAPEFPDTSTGTLIRSGTEPSVRTWIDVVGLRKDQRTFPAELMLSEFALDGMRRFTCVVRDITARKSLEDQFRQAQKIEAVGRLAGGVAHDFNNLLTVINGYSELLLLQTTSDHPLNAPAAAIHDAGERAARLTRQLLAFSRKAIVEPRILDLNTIVAQIESLLRRLIGEDILLRVSLDPQIPAIQSDAGQIEQLVMNLVVNARDAMPQGGTLRIVTSLREVTRDTASTTPLLKEGSYAVLSVQDSGGGMSDEVKARIFEPFFTTKGVGNGTGLGLAVVHGIVNQCGGAIEVDSTLGQGTTFRLYFPAITSGLGNPLDQNAPLPTRGTETILLVEDEEAVRKITALALEGQGYRVFVASDGEEALRLVSEHAGEIDLVITDVVMPVMSGRQVASHVRLKHPNLRVLYISGYTDDAILQHGVSADRESFLAKPFTPMALARRVRTILDAAASPPHP